VARWGGEEFVVILPGASHVIIKSVAERIRILIESSFLLVAEERVHVTVSIGATLSRANDSAESIVQRADGLMYRSKSCGRNQVTEDGVCSPSDP
jgi:diguanylate cyclase (GGDEF)-like protein